MTLTHLLLAAKLSAAAGPAPVRRMQYLMGTLCEVTAYGDDAEAAVSDAFAEIARWDRVLSLYKKESEATALNASNGRPFACSQPMWTALAASLAYAKASSGAFDPTILPVLRAGPSALASVGYDKLEFDAAARSVRFRTPGMAVDFGAIGKGIALDYAAAILRKRGVSAALINFGGQIYALGAPPDASAWPVRVAGSPAVLFLRDASVSTSGNSEQPGHIASPYTGERIRETYSATVIAPSAAEADAWSTALFVLGPAARPPYEGCWLFSGSEPSTAASCAPYLSKPSKGASK